MGHNTSRSDFAPMPKSIPPKGRGKRRKYVKPRVTKHGALPSTALAHSY
jgi:hypothetical protein